MSSEEPEPRPKVTKRPSWWKLFPAEYAAANRLVQENVAQYTPAKLVAMNHSSRLKVHSDLLNEVGLILPLKWKTATPNAVAVFVGTQKKSHRRKAGQPAIKRSKHAAAGAKRHDCIAELSEARRERKAGTLSADDPLSKKLDDEERVRL